MDGFDFNFIEFDKSDTSSIYSNESGIKYPSRHKNKRLSIDESRFGLPNPKLSPILTASLFAGDS